MQAPTTPGGPPAQEPSERACPDCGASNGLLAAFCWQCYRQFGTGPAASPLRPGSGPPTSGLRGAVTAPAPSSTSYRPPHPGVVPRAAGLLVIALAAAATAFFFLSRGPGVELPQSFGGMSRIDDPQVEAMLDAFEGQSSAEGVDAEIGLYGSAQLPTAALAWIADERVPDGEDAYAEFAAGFDAGLGTGSLDRTRTRAETVGGVEYVCTPVGGATPATICIWQDEVFWMLIDLSGSRVDGAVRLAVDAHDSTNA